MTDQKYMKIAIEEALKGTGHVSPNPLVGAVIVRDGEILAKGYHHYCGGLHAERDALKNCDKSAEGATMYVTLEPCCHHGRQPPCTDALTASGISRVVIGSGDPNPLVSGNGSRILREKGIEVVEYVLEEECKAINEIFFHYIKTGLPFVTMKYAMTADGKIACKTGLSKWITGEESRLNVHRDRNRFTAIMVGSGTILADDPLLTCCIEGGVDPVRIICDSGLRIPADCKVVKTADKTHTIICTCQADTEKHKPYADAGCEILLLPKKGGHIDISAMMHRLGEGGIDSILLEGGGSLNWSILSAGFVNCVQTYIAPKIFGGSAKSPVDGEGVSSPSDAFMLTDSKIMRFGDDIMIESRVKY